MTNLKPINTILYLSGAITKGAFSANEIASAVKQFQNGDVIPVIDTLTVLLNGKYAPNRNKSAIATVQADVAKLTTGIKSNFKKSGFALALIDIIKEDASIESGALFCEYAKTYSDELKAAYEATKPAKPQPVAMEPAPYIAEAAISLLPEQQSFSLADALALVELAILEGSLSEQQVTNLAEAIDTRYTVAA